MTLSKMSPGSGRAPKFKVLGITLRAYGVFAAPRCGYMMFWKKSAQESGVDFFQSLHCMIHPLGDTGIYLQDSSKEDAATSSIARQGKHLSSRHAFLSAKGAPQQALVIHQYLVRLRAQDEDVDCVPGLSSPSNMSYRPSKPR